MRTFKTYSRNIARSFNDVFCLELLADLRVRRIRFLYPSEIPLQSLYFQRIVGIINRG